MNHLNSSQLAQVLIGDSDPTLAIHLTVCEACRNEIECLQRFGRDLRLSSLTSPQPPEWWWTRQNIRVGQQIATNPRGYSGVAAAFSAAAGAIVLFLLLQMTGGLPLRHSTTDDKAIVASDSAGRAPETDELLRIQYAAYRTTPLALRPASRISIERNKQLNRKRSKDVQ